MQQDVMFASGERTVGVDVIVDMPARAVRTTMHAESPPGDTNVPAVSAGQRVTIVWIHNKPSGVWCVIAFDDKLMDIRPLDLQLL